MAFFIAELPDHLLLNHVLPHLALRDIQALRLVCHKSHQAIDALADFAPLFVLRELLSDELYFYRQRKLGERVKFWCLPKLAINGDDALLFFRKKLSPSCPSARLFEAAVMWNAHNTVDLVYPTLVAINAHQASLPQAFLSACRNGVLEMFVWLAETGCVGFSAQALESRNATTAYMQEGFIQACLTDNLAVVDSLKKHFDLTALHMNRALWLSPFVAIASTRLLTVLINEHHILDEDPELGPELYARAIAGKHHDVCDRMRESGFHIAPPSYDVDDEDVDEEDEDEEEDNEDAENDCRSADGGDDEAGEGGNREDAMLFHGLGSQNATKASSSAELVASSTPQRSESPSLLRKLSLQSIASGATTRSTSSATGMLARGGSSTDCTGTTRLGQKHGSFAVLAQRRQSSQLLTLSLLAEAEEDMASDLPRPEIFMPAFPTSGRKMPETKRMSQATQDASAFLEECLGVAKGRGMSTELAMGPAPSHGRVGNGVVVAGDDTVTLAHLM